MRRYILGTSQWNVPLRSYWDANFRGYIAGCCSEATLGATFGSHIAVAESCLGVTLLAAAAESHVGAMMTTMMTIMWPSNMAPKNGFQMWVPNVTPLQQYDSQMRLRCSSQQCGS